MAVSPDQVELVWPLVAPFIDSAYAAGDEFMPKNMVEQIKDRRLVLWIGIDGRTIVAAAVTALQVMRSGLVCNMVACGGSKLDLWSHGHLKMGDNAKAEGCGKMNCGARPGREAVSRRLSR